MNPSEKIIASVSEGKIQGFKNKSAFSGFEFNSFLGVPYGQSTAKYARFKDPVAVKPWKNILNATAEKGGCLQFSAFKKILDGSEDCLYNNIHTSSIPQNTGNESLKAVIVNIHPGAHFTGSADPEYFGSPNYVMHNNIVYVSVSFRLHILGFLNLDLEECSGNQALKDIILSLQWIQKNISNFGGDPNNITLLGSSSGAEIVHHLLISPRAKGLFHKAIVMGLYKYCPNVITRDHNSPTAFELAQDLGYKGSYNNKKLLLFYKKLDMGMFILSKPLFVFLKEFAPFYPNSPFLMTNDFGTDPVVPLFTKEQDLESMARIPLMIGFCENEAVMGFLPQFRELCNKNFYKSIRQNFFGWGSKLNDSQLKSIRNRIESYYLDGKSIELASLRVKCNIQTDIALSDLYTSLIDVLAVDLPSSVYVYKFEFEGNTTKLENVYDFKLEKPLLGTFHGADYSFWSCLQLNNQKGKPLNLETEDMVKKFTKLISTFAKTSNPNYEGITTQWEPTTAENPCYFSVNNDSTMVDGKLNGKRMELWENLKKELESNDLILTITDELKAQHLHKGETKKTTSS